jgi:hypothetical protein
MRIYVPSTLTGLAAAYAAAEVGPAPVTAFAATPALREWYAEGDDEELEYAALMQAARASLGLLADSGTADVRRVVIACEVTAVPPDGGAVEAGEARLEVGTVVPWSAVVAVHVDSPEAAGAVAAAVGAWPAAQNGDEDAMFTVDACEAEELLWYATQEVPDLLTEQDAAERS